MNLNSVKSVYFIGAGGIGMSALIRYFLANGKQVAGYDRTPSELTNKLIGWLVEPTAASASVPTNCPTITASAVL